MDIKKDVIILQHKTPQYTLVSEVKQIFMNCWK